MALDAKARRNFLNKELVYIFEGFNLMNKNSYSQMYLEALTFSREEAMPLSEVQFDYEYPEKIDW
jgi:hypothetical protein